MLKIAIADTGFIYPGKNYPSNEKWLAKFNEYWASDLLASWNFYDAIENKNYDPNAPPSHFLDSDHNHWVADTIAAIIDDEVEFGFCHMNVFAREYNVAGDPSGLDPIIRAVDYATNNKMPLLNLSLGYPKVIIEGGKAYRTAPPKKLDAFQLALDYYINSGGIPIIAAGNYYSAAIPDSGNWLCEEDCNNICVAAHTKGGAHAEFSSTSQRIDVSAIGTELNLVGRYGTSTVQGTSFATPQVLAILAILYDREQHKSKLEGTNAIKWAIDMIAQIAVKPVSSTGEAPNEESDSIFGIGSISRSIEWFRLKSQRELLRENLFGKHIYNYTAKVC